MHMLFVLFFSPGKLILNVPVLKQSIKFKKLVFYIFFFATDKTMLDVLVYVVWFFKGLFCL